MILDPETIPSEIKDQIEAAANDLGKGFVWIATLNSEPDNTDPRVLLLSQAFQRALTAVAMIVLQV